MIHESRQAFNQSWQPADYARLLDRLTAACGEPISFRICETPCFLATALVDTLVASGAELIRQLAESSDYRATSEAAIPALFRVPNEPNQPLFTQVDFGLVRNAAGEPEPRLVEIQGFPSLYAFQAVLSAAYDPPGAWRYHPAPLDNPGYWSLLGQAIVGQHDPENVVLLEIDPTHQKTRCDFVVTERRFGVRAVCITQLTRRANKLFYERDGRQVPIHRIYNRAIVDELERRKVQVPFDWRDDLNVEWAGHPNHYFRFSKFSLPFLRHTSVPQTVFLDRAATIPADLDRWVLKPLFSFAGLGVRVGPTKAEIEAIPPTGRSQWILQERCDFHPFFETPAGPTKAELRVMFIGQKAVGLLIRMGRGAMMGVDQNKGQKWVGASAAFWPAE